MNLCDAASETRRYMHFVDFDCARNGIAPALASGLKKRRYDRDEQDTTSRKLRLETQGGGRVSVSNGKWEPLFFDLMPGYSQTPLVRKLGVGANEKIIAINAPEHYAQLLEDLPDGASIITRLTANARFVHLFVTRRADLEKRLALLRGKLHDSGVLWVSWPKKALGGGDRCNRGYDPCRCAAARICGRESLCGR